MILIIDCGSSKIKNLKQIFKEFGYESEICKLENLSPLKSYDGIVISGGPLLLTEALSMYYLDYFKFIKSYKKPILGICLGHQIIGIKYGAKIYLGNEIREMQKIAFLKDDKLFAKVENNSLFKEDHTEYIDLPSDFILLATSKNCANEAMKHNKKPIYGLQFHPEISGDEGKMLLKNFAELCDLI